MASAELQVAYDPRELELYRMGSPTCRYYSARWQRPIGRSRHGEFPLAVVTHYFAAMGFFVLAAEPELPDGRGYMLLSYPGKRRAGHPAFLRMVSMFGEEPVRLLNRAADTAKIRRTGNRAGGDPDLLVFADHDRFFVEVKWRDRITEKQRAVFPLIEKYLKVPVRIVRIVPMAPDS